MMMIKNMAAKKTLILRTKKATQMMTATKKVTRCTCKKNQKKMTMSTKALSKEEGPDSTIRMLSRRKRVKTVKTTKIIWQILSMNKALLAKTK